MLFQTLDDKSECVGIYANKELVFSPEHFPENLSLTWKYVPYLRGLDVDYISLYLEGEKIQDYVPEYLQDDWTDVSNKIEAFRRSLTISKVSTQENCFYDLVPKRFLIEYCEVRNKITSHIAKKLKRPARYDFYKHVSMMLGDIAERKVKIDARKVRSYLGDRKLKNTATSLLNCESRVSYNQFGTKTGRLTTRPNTFPILTLNKSFRGAIMPQNDYFLELDFNGAEVRTLLGLLGKEQPSQDVHNFHLRTIFKSLKTRDEAKVAFFSWLYGSKAFRDASERFELESFYNKSDLLAKHWIDNTVTTPYKKVIKNTSRHHALNYLVQSTAADLALKQALKIDHLLRTQSTESCIAFIIHDAVVLDMKNEDDHLITLLVNLMSSTNFGSILKKEKPWDL